jgi:hypothetical protein
MYRVCVYWKVKGGSGSVIQSVSGDVCIEEYFKGTQESILKMIHVGAHRKLVEDLVLFTKGKELLDMSKTFKDSFPSHDKREQLELFTDFNPKRSERPSKRKRED